MTAVLKEAIGCCNLWYIPLQQNYHANVLSLCTSFIKFVSSDDYSSINSTWI